jgi:hypothetical protein
VHGPHPFEQLLPVVHPQYHFDHKERKGQSGNTATPADKPVPALQQVTGQLRVANTKRPIWLQGEIFSLKKHKMQGSASSRQEKHAIRAPELYMCVQLQHGMHMHMLRVCGP